jgi:chromosomal replication initiation ATPase DnaA
MAERTLSEIATATAQRHRVTVSAMRGRQQSVALQAARREFMAVAHVETRHSWQAIGIWLGRRERSTVRDAIRAHQRRAAFA